MIDLESIERTISDLESTRDTSFRLCERLAWLYIVRDHLKGTTTPEQPSQSVTGAYNGSEFLEAAATVSVDELMGVLDEHMEALKVVHPKEYTSVIGRIKALRKK